MSLHSKILRDALGNITVHMEGNLNFDHTQPLREELVQIANENPYSKIKIDLGGIDFVGASGIAHFVETIKILNNRPNSSLSLSNVRSEFVKVFKLYELNPGDIEVELFKFDEDDTEDMNVEFGNRRRTFEN
jgi:anti-sigma B factor antagonist